MPSKPTLALEPYDGALGPPLHLYPDQLVGRRSVTAVQYHSLYMKIPYDIQSYPPDSDDRYIL